MHNDTRAQILEQRQHGATVANIEFMVDETRQFLLEALLIPARVALRPEENCALIVVHAMHGVAQLAGKVGTHFGSNQAR